MRFSRSSFFPSLSGRALVPSTRYSDSVRVADQILLFGAQLPKQFLRALERIPAEDTGGTLVLREPQRSLSTLVRDVKLRAMIHQVLNHRMEPLGYGGVDRGIASLIDRVDVGPEFDSQLYGCQGASFVAERCIVGNGLATAVFRVVPA